jgi:hypothetical protein
MELNPSIADVAAAVAAGLVALAGVLSARAAWSDRERQRAILHDVEGRATWELKDLRAESWLGTWKVKDPRPIPDDERDASMRAIAEALRSLEQRVDTIEAQPPRTAEDRERLEFRALWDEAQARLKKYHELAVIQGHQSFRMLLLFSALGFGLLGFVVWRATTVKTTAGGIALGVAGTAGAALSAYIGRTFLRAYRDANERLIDYFAEPLDMSRLLVSERLLLKVDKQTRNDAVMRIIGRALSPKADASGQDPAPDDPLPSSDGQSPGEPRRKAAPSAE